MTETYERPEICSACEDVCCAIMPGIMWPEDVKRVAGTDSIGDALHAVLSTGDYAIDWWCGDPHSMSMDYSTRAYYVRPRCANHHNLFDPTWDSGACVFWNEATGCRLPAEQRPHECRNLEPRPGRECIQHGGGKQDAAIAWWPWHQIVGVVGHELEPEL